MFGVLVKQRARTSLIGRDDDLTSVRAALHKQGQPLLTLTGPGGCGKTRLALAVADAERERYPDGARVVELAPLTDPALVPQVVGAALGLREQSDRPFVDALAEAIADRHELLILDNCEHLADASADLVERLVQRSPNLRVLATSRTPLGVVGEHTWQVQPLTQPYAVELFVERATAARRTFELTAENSAAIHELCRRLDGLPLAIELTAAQTRVLGVEEIAQRLDQILDATAPTASRQRTLRATIDWSFLMLSAAEQAVFARLAVFAGGWSVPAAEAVCSADLAVLTRLVDQSLVVVEERHGAARHRLLEVIRQYAAERLVSTGEADLVAERHARYFAALADRHGRALTGSDPGRAMAVLEADHDNVRAALTWLAEHAPDAILHMAGALWWFWFRGGTWREGRRWLERALGHRVPSAPASPAERLAVSSRESEGVAAESARQSNAESEPVGLSGRPSSGESAAQRARSAARARALLGLGVLAWAQGDHPLAAAVLAQSIELARAAEASLDLGLALQFLAMEVLGSGDVPRAAGLADESLALLREAGQPVALAIALASRGVSSLAGGDYAAARAPLAESVDLLRAAHDPWALALPLRNLGIVAFLSGHPEAAASLLRESLQTLQDQPDPWFVSRSLETLAVVTASQGQHTRAARLFGAGEALRARVGAAVLPFYRFDYERAYTATRAALGESAFASAVREGRAMRIDEALAFALAAPPDSPDRGLSPREREVLALLARGASNRAIAEQLVITDKTVEAHVSAILRKLNLASRAQVAAWAAEHARETP